MVGYEPGLQKARGLSTPRCRIQVDAVGLSRSKKHGKQDYSFVKASHLNPRSSISKNDGRVADREEKRKGLEVRFMLSHFFLLQAQFPLALVEDEHVQNEGQGINPLTYSWWQR